MFSPALISSLHYRNSLYYSRIDSLFSFFAFAFTTFSLLIIFKIPRNYTIPLVLFGITCVAYHIFMGKAIGFQTMAAMYETNFAEMIGFISSPLSIPLILGGGVGAGVVIWYIVRPKQLWKLTKETYIQQKYLFVLMIVAFALFFTEGTTILYTYPINVFYTNYRYFDESRSEKEYLKKSYTFNRSYNSDFKSHSGELFILIIGEAARRDALTSYGAKEDTTPCLNQDLKEKPNNILLFKEVISTSAYTRGSVPTMLSTYDINDIEKLLSRPSLSKIMRGAGFKTLYVTTRPRYILPNIVSICQDDAEEVHYLSTLKDKKYDGDVLPIVNEFIEKHKDENKFIVVHLMGSHIKYAMQYPESENYFSNGDEMWDTYNNSIRYSDYVIHQIANSIMEYKKPAFAIYASDHGENLNDYGDGNYGHGTRDFTRFEFEIPFIAYVNDPFLDRYNKKFNNLKQLLNIQISQDNISHTFLGLSGVWDEELYLEEKDLSSNKFKAQTRYVIDENMNLYNYDLLNLEKRMKK